MLKEIKKRKVPENTIRATMDVGKNILQLAG
jgi:hypothetical protein